MADSHKLSWLLRHGAVATGLSMDAAGWAPVSEVLAHTGMSCADLEAAVARDGKGRLELDGDRIRAAQGHSRSGTPVSWEALEASWSPASGLERVWHGTAMEALPGIAAEGLRPGERTHVHLAEHPESRVGKRADVAVLLEVSVPALAAEGVGLFRSPNGVLLARAVPRACIVGWRAVTRRARKEEAAIRALFGTS